MHRVWTEKAAVVICHRGGGQAESIGDSKHVCVGAPGAYLLNTLALRPADTSRPGLIMSALHWAQHAEARAGWRCKGYLGAGRVL